MSDILERNHPHLVFRPGRLISVVLVTTLVVLIINSLITNPNYH